MVNEGETNEGGKLEKYTAKLRKAMRQVSADQTVEIWYRGQSNAHWLLQSGAAQRIDSEEIVKTARGTTSGTTSKLTDLVEYHKNLLETAKLMGWNKGSGGRELTELQLLAILQHHGAATCLLDFTASFNVALWFACQKTREPEIQFPARFSLEDYKAVKHQFRTSLKKLIDSSTNVEEAARETELVLKERFPDGIHELLQYWLIHESGLEFVDRGTQKNGKVFFVPLTPPYKSRIFRRVSTDEIGNKFNFFLDPEKLKEISRTKQENGGFWIWEPEAFMSRMLSQYSRFLFGPHDISRNKNLYKEIIIEAEDKEDLLAELEQQQGLKPRTIFSDIHGFASSNARGIRYQIKYNPLVKAGDDSLQMGKFKDAVDAYDEALSERPGDCYALFHRARAIAFLGPHKEAIEAWSRVIESCPEVIWAWFNRGCEYRDLGEFSSAINDFEMAKSKGLKGGLVDFNCALTKGRLGCHKEAIELWNKVVPSFVEEAYFERGWNHYNLEQYDQAISDFDEEIRLVNNEHGEAWYYRGLAKEKLGQLEEAIDNVERAVCLFGMMDRSECKKKADKDLRRMKNYSNGEA